MDWLQNLGNNIAVKLSGIMIIFIAFVFHGITLPVFGQKAVKELRAGNSLYEKGIYKAAEISYRKSLEQQNNYSKAMFNLGDAMYKQQKYDEANKIFQNLTEADISKDMAAKAYHNLGNSLLQQKKYQESIDAYKNALKQKPNDLDTKYNLEYAKKKIIQQQQQQQQNKQDQQKQDQQKQDQQKQEQQKQDQKPNKDQQNKQNQISKQDAERMLNALQNKEKNLLEKKKEEIPTNVKYSIEKDW
jgi:Ca-activated chloride channel homolog